MRMNHHLRAPDDPIGRGAKPTGAPDKADRADLEKPVAETPKTPDTDQGERHISGPGPNDLTRGLP